MVIPRSAAFHSIATPDILKGRIALLGVEYPLYRLFIIAVGIAIAAALVLVIDRTLVGATLQFSPNVPAVVTGEPLTLKSEFGALKPTLVTVPLPLTDLHAQAEPFQERI